MAYSLYSDARRERLVLGEHPAFVDADFDFALMSGDDPAGEVHAYLVEGGQEPADAAPVARSCAEFVRRHPDWRVEVV